MSGIADEKSTDGGLKERDELLEKLGGDRKDRKEAFQRLNELKEEKDWDWVEWLLALCYEFGLGTKKKPGEANSYYERKNQHNSRFLKRLAENQSIELLCV